MRPFDGKLAILQIQPVLQPDRKPLIEEFEESFFSPEVNSKIKDRPADNVSQMSQIELQDVKLKLEPFTGNVQSLPIRPVELPHIKPQRREKKFTCDLCQKGVGTKGGLLYHMKAHLNGRPFKCKICKRSYSTKNDFDTHNQRHSGNFFTCDYCIKKFSTKQYLADHISLVHFPRVIKCQYCKKDKFFSSVRALKMHENCCHMEARSGQTEYLCKFCGWKAIRQSDFELHLSKAKEMRFQCKTCLQKFSCIKLLSKHLKKEKNMRVQCKVCYRSFKNISYHMRRYHNKALTCEFCKFKTKSSSKFSSHSRQCASQDKLRSKGHLCSECNKYFYSEGSLKIHYSKKHGAFKCTICPTLCNTRKAFLNHTKRHQKNPIRCLCPKHPMFPNMKAFNAHFDRSHSSMGLTHDFYGICCFCIVDTKRNKTCKTKTELKKHILQCHLNKCKTS